MGTHRPGLHGIRFCCGALRIFLRQLQINQHDFSAQSYGLSLWFGTALIAAGVIVNVFSGWHHARLVRELDHEDTTHSRPSTPAVALAFFLAIVGLAMATYLVVVRSTTQSHSGTIEEVSMTPSTSTVNGIEETPSNHSVEQTVERVKAILQAKGLTLFALVDHSGEAEKVGLKMGPTKLLILGSPKGGTPVMLAAPSVAIDLPLKILVREDAQGKVWVSHNNPEYLKQRHNIPDALLQNISGVRAIVEEAVC
jgi:uncharacterized protein (DUF302 family)